jgi:membrane carboxypeptidase/penicillin-binding protein
VFVRGTAHGAAAGIPGDVAGKTGTTNKRRDSWFGGYSPERATVVWVGYDDNSSTRLSGARAALPLWVRFTAKVAPRSGYSTFPQPPGVTTAVIDPSTGLLGTEFCPYVITEVFREGDAPSELCNRHGSYFDAQMAEAVDGYGEDEMVDSVGGENGNETAATTATEDRRERKRHPLKRWLKKVFGSGRDERDTDEKRDDGNRPPV